MPSKLTYLRVDKFRHVKPGSELRFGGQINAVVGRNGAGKTTLLGLVSALKVRAIVRGHLAKTDSSAASGSRLECAMSKLITLTPHYSIEAWLFANVAQLRQVGATGAILDEWHADLSKLEQSIKPKDLVSVSTRHYPTLARGLKTAKLYGLGSSFFETVNRAGACGSLITRLRNHWPDWVRKQYDPQDLVDAK